MAGPCPPAAASWDAGQAVWSWYELVAGLDTPFPSVADVGFLGFPVGARPGSAVLHPSGGRQADRRRRVLDGLIGDVGSALVSWSTVLRTVVAEG